MIYMYNTVRIIQDTHKLYIMLCVKRVVYVYTHIIRKGEIYQKPKTLIVWIGET